MSIKSARLKAGKSVAELARYLDVSPQAVWLWETGKFNPRADRYRQMALYLDCGITELFAQDTHPAEGKGNVDARP